MPSGFISFTKATPNARSDLSLAEKTEICVWAVQKDIKKWWLWQLISHFALGDDVQSCYNQHNSASYTISHTYCACHRLLKENISQTETFRHFQVCSLPYICRWMKPATTDYLNQKCGWYDSTPMSTSCSEYLWNLYVFSPSLCSHPSSGHPHFFPVFLQDLPDQSVSAHHFLYTIVSDLIRSTTLLQNTLMRSLLSSSFQDTSPGARRSGYVCSVAFGVEGLASQGSGVLPSWSLGAGLWAYCVPLLRCWWWG